MLRPTSSPILYFQQLGRALTTGNKKNPLVFDIVNNIKCLRDIENLRDSIVRIMTKSSKTKEEIELVVKNFRIIDDYKEISQLLEELDINSTYGWDENYEKLKEFIDKNGRFPKCREDCADWLNNQRQFYRKGKLSNERETKLNLLGDWLNPQKEIDEQKWNKKYEELKKFVEENGRFPTKSEPCGDWLIRQRKYYRKGKLSNEREIKLNLLGDWFISREEVDEQKWNKKYEELKKFVEENGRFPTKNELCGDWLITQRFFYRRGKLSKEKETKLNLLGNWLNSQKAVDEQKWNKKYEELKKFVEENGRFPKYREDCADWLNNQRQFYRKGKLSKEREAKLNLLGDWHLSKKEIDEQRWNENYEKLKEFVNENHRFPIYNELCGEWLNHQRKSYRKGKLSNEREAKLNLLGDWLTPTGRRRVTSIERNAEEIKDRKPRT